MESFQLSKQDYANMSRIIAVTRAIGSLYKKMADLEAAGKQDIGEFEKLQEHLKLAIEVEEKVYQDANLDYLKCREMAQFLNKSDDVQDEIVNQDYEFGWPAADRARASSFFVP